MLAVQSMAQLQQGTPDMLPSRYCLTQAGGCVPQPLALHDPGVKFACVETAGLLR